MIKRFLKKRYIIPIFPILLLAVLLGSWLPFQPTVNASGDRVAIQNNILYQYDLENAEIIYPPEISDDFDKLCAVYSLINELRVQHNEVAELARSSPKKYLDSGKFLHYIEIEKPLLKSLLYEQSSLKEKIFETSIYKSQWEKLSPESQYDAYLEIFGDKSLLRAQATSVSCDELTLFKTIDINELEGFYGLDPVEDYSSAGWNSGSPQSDPGSDLSLDGTNKIDVLECSASADTFWYRDMGSGHFDGDFTHRVDIYLTGSGEAARCTGLWALSNSTDSYYDIDVASGDALNLAMGEGGGKGMVFLSECDSGADYYDSYSDAGMKGALVYVEVERDEAVGDYGTLYAYLCLDDYYSNGGSLEDTLALTLHTSKKDFQYVYAIQGKFRSGGGGTFSGYQQNLDLQEAGGEVSIYQSPSSKAFGTLAESSTFWSSGSEPSWPLGAGDCYFTVTNNGTSTIDISANGTNWTGGVGWTLTGGSPGENTVRLSLYQVSDNATDNLTLGTSPLSWISSLAASDNVSWEIKLETGTFTDGVAKEAHIYLIASAS